MDGYSWGIVIFIVVAIALAIAKASRLEEAKVAYQNSLARLRENPTDAELHRSTLALGRAYSNLTRNNKGVTVYDEMALMNDINAACAGAVALTIQQRQQPPLVRVAPDSRSNGTTSTTEAPQLTASSLEERLMRLSRLKEQGLVTDEEYQEKRQQILSEM